MNEIMKYFREEATRAKKIGLTKRQFIFSQFIVLFMILASSQLLILLLKIIIILFEKY